MAGSYTFPGCFAGGGKRNWQCTSRAKPLKWWWWWCGDKGEGKSLEANWDDFLSHTVRRWRKCAPTLNRCSPHSPMQSNLVDSVTGGNSFIADSSTAITATPLFLFLLRIDVEKVLWRALAMVAGSNNGSRLLPFEGVTILPATALNNAPLATKAENVT